jgi:exopolysaccharide biosynthesis polyprenyl glycosylphosphotransferase
VTATPVRLRLELQRRAGHNLRHHAFRAAMRFGVLVVADLASFTAMRALLAAIRHHGVLGAWLAARVEALTPYGILDGWQYATGLFVSLIVLGCYGAGDQRRDARRLFAACALATALPLWMTVWMRGLGVVAVPYALTTALVWAGLLLERLAMDRVVGHVRSAPNEHGEALFVGQADECRRVMGSPAFREFPDLRSAGFVDASATPAADALGPIAEFPRVLAASGAQAVLICGYLEDRQFEAVVDSALASGCEVYSVPRVVELAGVRPILERRDGQPLIHLTAARLGGRQRFVKRSIDVLAATAGMLLLSPLMAVLAVLVKLDSRGPVFFRQERVGQGGRLFTILKFRSMVEGAEGRREELASQSLYRDLRLFKVRNDPRVTRLGRWLRRTSLDELPQLANVLLGEMSLVGPRPPLPSEVAMYERHHFARFDVKPGMTGPWQVTGRNEVTDFEGVVALESKYIRNWSLGLDLVILLRTLPVVLKMRGAH